MKTNFNELEAIRMAVQIEERGEVFYLQAGNWHLIRKPGRCLKNWQSRNRTTQQHFNKSTMSCCSTSRALTICICMSRGGSLLAGHGRKLCFPTDELKEVMGSMKDITKALELGIQAEKDSILFILR